MPTYHEDGCIMQVTILENTSDNEWERYTLRVDAIIQSSSLTKDPIIGETFTCNKQKNYNCNGLWHLFI